MRNEPLTDLSHLVQTERAQNGASKPKGIPWLLDFTMGVVVWSIMGWFGLVMLGFIARSLAWGLQAGWELAGKWLGL